MSGTPWSVKGIDSKAREVAKDLARRSGMTLGEWLNQMILRGEDVEAVIRRERQKAAPRVSRAPEVVYDEAGYDQEDAFFEDEAPRHRPAPRSDLRRETRVTARAEAPRRPAPFSSAARRAPVAEPYYDDGAPSGDIGRVARVLDTLGSRIESSELRSASAVRGVSQAVEALLNRLERSESSMAETLAESEARFSEQAREVMDNVVATGEGLAERVEAAERLVDAQAERLEGLSGHLREERERVARLESELRSAPAQAAIEAVEGAVGRLSNQLYENDMRVRDTVKDVRGDLVGLSHRLSQLEMRDPDVAAQALIDRMAAQFSQRLETAEARTSTALRALEQAFAALDTRLGRAEALGDVTDPESVQSLGRLTEDFNRRIEESRHEMRRLFDDGRRQSLDETLVAVDARLRQAETRQARAVETLGQDVLKIAESLNRKVAEVQKSGEETAARQAADLKRLGASVEARLEATGSAHASALERLGGEIARISESLGRKVAEAERRATQVLEGVGEELDTRHQRVHSDIAERIRQSEERTQKLLDEARSKIDARLGQVQTSSLLREASLRETAGEALASPFAPTELQQKPFSAFERGFDAAEPVKDAEAEEDSLDLTGRLLAPVTGFADDPFEVADPFAEDKKAAAADEDDLLMAAHKSPVAADPFGDDFDSDPFAEVDASRKASPVRAESVRAEALHTQPAPAGAGDIFAAAPDDFYASIPAAPVPETAAPYEDAGVSMSTRDALAAARAAVRASVEGPEKKGLSGLKLGTSRTRDAQPKPPKGKGKTLLNAFKASSVAVILTAGAVGTYYLARGHEEKPRTTALAANAVTTTKPASEAAEPMTAEKLKRLKALYASAMMALEANDPKAVDALRTVADLGYPQAQFQMSRLYDEGRDGLIVADKVQARRWVERAARAGHPSAMYNLGLMNYNGEGGPVDYTAAATWLRRSAEYGVRDGQFGIGVMYMQGQAVSENAAEAYKWLSIAAQSGDKEAGGMLRDIRRKLTPEQIATVDTAVKGFKALAPVVEDTALAAR